MHRGERREARGEKEGGLSPDHLIGDCSLRVAVLVSGNGSNLQTLIDEIEAGNIDGQIVIVICNNEQAYALQRAKNAGINTEVVLPTDFADRRSFDNQLVKILDAHEVDLVVLAGYMLICTEVLVDHYYGRIINVHPSLLPSFAGTDGIGDAFKYGVKVTGATVHFVDKDCDTGPIILQESVVIDEEETQKSLAAKVHKVEHRLLPKAVRYFAEGKLKLKGRKVIIG